MRQLAILAGCAVLLAAIAGCQNAETDVELVVEVNGPFPDSLAGRWTADSKNWEFVFEPGGGISSAVIDNGMIRVDPRKKVHRLEQEEAEGVYELGQWTVQYTPESRELAVGVVLDHFSVGKDGLWLEGKSTDWFMGPVSPDSKTWTAEWFTFPKYFLVGEEKKEFPFDPNDNPIETLVFRRR